MPQTGLHIKTDGTTAQVAPANGKTFSLDELQKYVGGYIELIHTRTPRRKMYINEEGLIHGLIPNLKATELIDPHYNCVGAVRGDALIIETRQVKEKESKTPCPSPQK